MAESKNTVEIGGCASEWEGNKELRQLLRKTGSIFVPEAGKSAVEPTICAAGVNLEALLPVMKRLRDPTTSQLGMVSIPNVEAELPNFN